MILCIYLPYTADEFIVNRVKKQLTCETIYYAAAAQVAQARNMSIGEHRHCCVTFKI